MLLAGAENGIHVIKGDDENRRVLDSGRVMRLLEGRQKLYAATSSGLYVSNDGVEWRRRDTPKEEVFSVSIREDELYIGTHPAHIYVSHEGGWRELQGFTEIPGRESWHTPRHRNSAHVRSLHTPADKEREVVAGVEVGGVFVSEDDVESWTAVNDSLHPDIHHLLRLDRDGYLAATGDGLYHTEKLGESWSRMDDEVQQRYFRESIRVDDSIYTAAASVSPPGWSDPEGARAAVFEFDVNDGSLREMDCDVTPEDVVLAWTVRNDEPVAGTNGGKLLVNREKEWRVSEEIDGAVRSMLFV
ncbi:MAG: glycosyl hydrolase [Halobacteria archaeon]